MELRGFWCGTEGFRVLKRCGPCVELRGTRYNLYHISIISYITFGNNKILLIINSLF